MAQAAHHAIVALDMHQQRAGHVGFKALERRFGKRRDDPFGIRAAQTATPSPSERACQNAAIARGAWRLARTSIQPLTSRKHQLASDIASNSQATTW